MKREIQSSKKQSVFEKLKNVHVDQDLVDRLHQKNQKKFQFDNTDDSDEKEEATNNQVT